MAHIITTIIMNEHNNYDTMKTIMMMVIKMMAVEMLDIYIYTYVYIHKWITLQAIIIMYCGYVKRRDNSNGHDDDNDDENAGLGYNRIP